MKLFNQTIWAITPEMLQTMMSLAKENNKPPEAIAREMGKEMKDSNAASVRDGVCVIRLCGPLFRYANLLTKVCGATSYELFAQDFNKALKDPTIKAIVLDIDSPGGEVNGCSEVADIIYKARGQKPIIAYASGACCSGAYWIASSCDRILAADTAILGSIGVVSIFEKNDEDKTIEIVSSQSPNKRPNVQTEAGRAKIQAHVDALADVFGNLDGAPRFDKKEMTLAPYYFQVVVENDSIPYYFTEKIIDCFLELTIPVYIGATKIGQFFNADGIIQIKPEEYDQVDEIVKKLSPEFYLERVPAILENYRKAKDFCNTNKYLYDRMK